MRQIKEILRLKFEHQLSIREIARSCTVPASTVGDYLKRAELAGLSWPFPEEWAEEQILERLLGASDPGPEVPLALPDWAHLHEELRRQSVTLRLLWQEYRQTHPEGYGYSRFCELYERWAATLDPVLRQVHPPGEKMFVDWAGQTIPIYTSTDGTVAPASLFVAVLGASNKTFVQAFPNQKLACWIAAHVHAYAFFGGVSKITVPDNTKTAVIKTCRYEPLLHASYQEMAQHYGTVILPARPAHPRDKPKIEVAVQIVERWILARLRHETFFALAALNARIAELLADLNARPMRLYRASRSELFARLDQPALRPLPAEPFVYGEWKVHARVNIDYHIELRGHYYSVPYALIHEQVDARLTATTVEIFHRGQRVAAHLRSHVRGRHTTDPAHMPKAHQRHLEWTPSRLTTWARTIGPQTAALVQAILADRPHPEQGYRSCLGLLRLGKRYGEARLEAACARAVIVGARSYRHVDSMLKHGLDRLAVPEASPQLTLTPAHDHLRGPAYYQ